MGILLRLANSAIHTVGESLTGPEESIECETVGVGPHSQLLHSQKVEEREEGMRRPPKPPAKDPPKLLPDPFPVAEFGSHVERNHTNNNQPFATEFEVQILHQMHASAICAPLLWCCVLCRHWAMGKGSQSQ